MERGSQVYKSQRLCVRATGASVRQGRNADAPERAVPDLEFVGPPMYFGRKRAEETS